MEEIVPHKADLSSLQVIGHGTSRRKSQQKNDVEVHVHEKDKEYETEVTDNIQIDYDDDKENENIGDSLDDLPDIVDAPIMGKLNTKIEL
jgi:hypothetical protein